MGNHIFMLFLGNPKRRLWTLTGAAVLFAVISPDHFNWVMVWAFNALWPWVKVVIMLAIVGGALVFNALWPLIKVAIMLAIVGGVLVSIVRPKKGG